MVIFCITYSVILRYASTWSSAAAILSSRIRRRGSKSPSHSGIVTIFSVSLNASQKIKLRNSLQNGHKQPSHFSNFTKVDRNGSDSMQACFHGASSSRNMEHRSRYIFYIFFNAKFCSRQFRFTLKMCLLHKMLDQRRESYQMLPLNSPFCFSGQFLPRRFLCKSRQIYE